MLIAQFKSMVCDKVFLPKQQKYTYIKDTLYIAESLTGVAFAGLHQTTLLIKPAPKASWFLIISLNRTCLRCLVGEPVSYKGLGDDGPAVGNLKA